MIYCVEDERNIRELLVYTLETTGFEAEGFETGVEFDAAMKKPAGTDPSGHYAPGRRWI